MFLLWGSVCRGILTRHIVATTTLTILLMCSLVRGRESSTAMTPRRHPHMPEFQEYQQRISSIQPKPTPVTLPTLSRLQRRETSEEQMSSSACQKFTQTEGTARSGKFYSPNHPYDYPNNTDCVRVLDAGSGNIIKMDFLDDFVIEDSENCQYDYLEVRDGGHGYDHLIGKFCGKKHPPTAIHSKGRYLWVHFHSDDTIEYKGFTAVYSSSPRPTINTPHPPEMENCIINKNGTDGYVRSTDIDKHRIDISKEYKVAVECMWVIRVEVGWKILLTFEKFELERPNDCESNFVEVFKEHTNIPSRISLFCGAVADHAMTENNIMHVRYYADKTAYNKSSFEALFTAFHDGNKQPCKDDEYDCQDDRCIARVLRCNGRLNCRSRSDEDPAECSVDRNKIADIISSEHIIIILVIFCLILSGMCFAFLYNCIKKLVHDHKIIREHIRQSREGRLDEVGKAAPPLMSPQLTSSVARSRVNSSSAGGGGNPLLPESEHDDSSPHRSAPDDCYVPGAGDLLPILLGANRGTSVPAPVPPGSGVPANGDAVFLRESHHHHHYGEDECDDLEMSTFPPPEMRDNECQTRESLFLNTNSDHSVTPPPPPPPITPRYNSINTSESRSIPRPPQHNNSSSNTSGFSTFGYDNRGGSSTRGGKEFSTLPQQGHHHYHHHHHAGSIVPSQLPPVPQTQFRAEAVIEMEQQQQRPFSVDSTKSAPDVIVTH